MNRKILSIIVLTAILVGGLYYFTIIKKSEFKEDFIPESNAPEVENNKYNEEEIDDEVTADIAIGNKAPDFTLKNLDGNEVSLKDYRGKIVLINFWSTRCKYCDIEMPDIERIDNENEDLVVLAVNVMDGESRVRQYIEKGGYDFEVILDENGDIAKTYLVGGFPTSYFIDEDGILLGGITGMITYAQMNEIIESIRKK